MRELYTAHLEQKLLLSASAQCYHLEFASAPERELLFEPGQFLSLIADDEQGKTYTRAYSLASAPRGSSFDLCLNRVEGGFFSNRLCDLQPGETVQFHGPHGLFTLRPAPGLMIAASTGIAPLRGFLQWLFPQAGPDRSEGRAFRLIYEAPQHDELLYDEEFRRLAETRANFRYLPVLGQDGSRENTERAIAGLSDDLAGARPALHNGLPEDAAAPYAYVCGLSEFVKTARAQLLNLGWQKRQILFERYD